MTPRPIIQFAVAGLLIAGVPHVVAQETPRPDRQAQRRPDPARLLEQYDANKDGALQRDELPARMKERFGQMDADGDGNVTADELKKMMGRQSGPAGAAGAPDALFRLLDADGDGKLSKAELEGAAKLLDKLDKNGSGAIERDELPANSSRGSGGRPGEVITPAAKGERQTDKLKVGDPAVDFTLPLTTGKGEVTLSSFQGKRPVVLIFASYT